MMLRSTSMKSRFVGVFALALFSTSGFAALAQTAPQPAPAASSQPAAPAAPLPTMPPNTNPVVQSVINALATQLKAQFGWESNRARGVVTYFRRFEMQVQFSNGTYRSIHLHKGTIINPRGFTIQQGQHVDVQGQATSDGSINADVITLT